MFTLVTSCTPSTTVANTMQATLVKTGTQSAQDCAAVSLATPSGRKVLMNPLSKWLAPVALLALVLVQTGTAWSQTAVLPTLTVTPASYTVNLQPSKTNETVNIGRSGRFAYKAAGSPEPTVECTASGGPPLDGGYASWQVTFTQADDGKTYTYTLIASNVAGVSKPATCTVTVKWNGATAPVTPVGPGVTPVGPGVTPVGPGVTPPVVTPPVVTPPPGGGPPITGTNGTGRQKSAREIYREARTPSGAPKAIIPTRATATDQSPANRTNPRMALRLGLAGGGGGNSTNVVANGGALPAPIAPPLGN